MTENTNPQPIGHTVAPVAQVMDPVAVAAHNRNALILEWSNTQKAMAELKIKEANLRKEVLAMEFANPEKATGTNRVQLGNGYALKAVLKYTYSIKKNEAVTPPDYSHLPGILAKLPRETALSLIKWTPSLNESAYKLLTKEEQLIANEFLTISNGSSSLELEHKPKK